MDHSHVMPFCPIRHLMKRASRGERASRPLAHPPAKPVRHRAHRTDGLTREATNHDGGDLLRVHLNVAVGRRMENCLNLRNAIWCEPSQIVRVPGVFVQEPLRRIDPAATRKHGIRVRRRQR